MAEPGSQSTLKVGRRSLRVSNLGKIFYPETGFTKGEMIDYYVRIAPVLLPHLKGRPLSLKRYPDGVEGFFFYEKQCPAGRPDWVKTAKVAKDDGGEICYCVINDLPSLVWAANLADLELHPFLHRAPALQRPTALAFDLDPGAPADARHCCRAALLIRELLGGLGLESFAKTSGSKGVQLLVPLNSPVNYTRTKAFARTIAEGLEAREPELAVSRMAKKLRKGKVFIDWSQNDDKKTTVCVYSLRAKSRPTVSTPLTWGEVEDAARARKPPAFTAQEVLLRVEKLGDLFAPVLSLEQKLPPLRSLEKAVAEW